MKIKLSLAFVVLTFGLLCWVLLGSFNVKEVVGQRCGLEMVVPCIMYDVTREVDVLDKYRIYAALVTGIVFIISLVLMLKFGNHNARKN